MTLRGAILALGLFAVSAGLAAWIIFALRWVVDGSMERDRGKFWTGLTMLAAFVVAWFVVLAVALS